MNQRVRTPRSIRTSGKATALAALLVVAVLLFAPLSPAAAPPTFQPRSPLTITVRAVQGGDFKGSIRSVSVLNIVGAETPIKGLRKTIIKSGKVEDQNEQDLLDGLGAYLMKAKKTVANKETVEIQADGALRIKKVLRIMEICRVNGFPKIQFVPPSELRAR